MVCGPLPCDPDPNESSQSNQREIDRSHRLCRRLQFGVNIESADTEDRRGRQEQ